jgi:hypothetical protein
VRSRHRPLAFAVSLELVQSDAFKWTQVLQGAGDVQCRQQIQRSGKIQAAGRFTLPHLTAGGVAPRLDHGRNVLRSGQSQQLFRRHPVQIKFEMPAAGIAQNTSQAQTIALALIGRAVF